MDEESSREEEEEEEEEEEDGEEEEEGYDEVGEALPLTSEDENSVYAV